MAIHRYWRIVGIQTNSNTDLELSEFRFYNLANLVDVACIITSSISPFSGNLSYLIDNNSTNTVLWKYSSWSQSGFSIKYDFGSGQGVEYPKFRIGSGSSQSTWLQDCIIQYSDDNINWIGYFSLTNIHYPGAYSLTALPDSGTPDIYYSNVSLLINGNGVNGSTTIIDVSKTPKQINVIGNTQISTTKSKYGGSSIYFDGIGDYLSVPTSTDFDFGVGDFTMEAWINPSVTATQMIFCRQVAGATMAMQFILYGAALGITLRSSAGGTVFSISGGTISTNTFTNVAVVRYNNTINLYVNGISVVSGVCAFDLTCTRPLAIGIGDDTTLFTPFTGYMDDIRITKGVARYTANFTPPTAELSIYPIALDAYTARFNRTSNLPNRILPTLELPTGSGYSTQKEYLFNEAYYGGNGLISGTTKIKNTVSNIPAMKRVVLIDERSKLVIAEQWSDSVTGYFEFRGFRTDILYTLLSYDHTGAFNAVVAVSVVPTLII